MKASSVFFGAIGGTFSGFFYRSEAEKVLLMCLFLAVILDYITGIAAAYKKGVPISSKRMRESVPKLVSYLAFVLLAVIVTEAMKASGMAVPTAPVLGCVLGLLIAIELNSVLENIHKSSGIKIPFIKRLLDGFTPDSAEETKK